MPLSAEDGHRVFEYFRWNMSRPDLVEGGLVRLERPDKWRQIHRRWIVSGPGLFGYRWDQKQIKDIAKYWVPLVSLL